MWTIAEAKSGTLPKGKLLIREDQDAIYLYDESGGVLRGTGVMYDAVRALLRNPMALREEEIVRTPEYAEVLVGITAYRYPGAKAESGAPEPQPKSEPKEPAPTPPTPAAPTAQAEAHSGETDSGAVAPTPDL